LSRRRYIRHKLLYGLALVLGIMAALLAGTCKGLFSYRQTMKSMNSKLAELRAVGDLHEAVRKLAVVTQDDAATPLSRREILEAVSDIERLAEQYREHLAQTLIRYRDSDNGREERALLARLRRQLQAIKEQAEQRRSIVLVPNAPMRPSTDEKLASLVRDALLTVATLRDHLHTDLDRRIMAGQDAYRTTLALVLGSSVVGVVLLLGLARLAYRWIAAPVRLLHDKVRQLSQGEFGTRIQIQTGDEIEELAEAFNVMTDRLEAMYRDLARQVNERSRQLIRSERLASLGYLAAGVAHEINNPLASIALCSEALERRIEEALAGTASPDDTATIRRYLRLIQQEAFRCKGITQKLLEFSRVGERQRREVADLAELVRHVLDLVSHLQAHQGKKIAFEVQSRPRVEVNPAEIKSVILNLTVNALESMDPGGQLTIRLGQRDSMAELVFQDTGCGMTPEVLENIFEPFFTRSRTGRGTGLGLSISHRVITQHGGEIEASSPGPNQGSTFIVRLPLAGAVPQTASLAQAA